LLISINDAQRNGLTISIPSTCTPWLGSSVSTTSAALDSAAALDQFRYEDTNLQGFADTDAIGDRDPRP